jgi:hypothetical protein
MLQRQKYEPVFAKTDYFGHDTSAVAEMYTTELSEAQYGSAGLNRQARHTHDRALAV